MTNSKFSSEDLLHRAQMACDEFDSEALEFLEAMFVDQNEIDEHEAVYQLHDAWQFPSDKETDNIAAHSYKELTECVYLDYLDIIRASLLSYTLQPGDVTQLIKEDNNSKSITECFEFNLHTVVCCNNSTTSSEHTAAWGRVNYDYYFRKRNEQESRSPMLHIPCNKTLLSCFSSENLVTVSVINRDRAACCGSTVTISHVPMVNWHAENQHRIGFKPDRDFLSKRECTEKMN